jgi:putative Mg2+ transporter-C (MgtC) family protein
LFHHYSCLISCTNLAYSLEAGVAVMDLKIEYEFGLRILVSFLVGTAIGFEREYRSKAAGLRTMIMICLGSTVFTLISLVIEENSKDRIASTIVTGVGFLGAGVIFKDGLTVRGLTTASTIWISAALGMAIGVGEYFVAFISSAVVILVLSVLERIQVVVEQMHQVRSYSINISQNEDFTSRFEEEMRNRKIQFRKKRDIKETDAYLVAYDCSGNEKNLDSINSYLKENKHVLWYHY